MPRNPFAKVSRHTRLALGIVGGVMVCIGSIVFLVVVQEPTTKDTSCFKNTDCNPDWVNAMLVVGYVLVAVASVAGYFWYRHKITQSSDEDDPLNPPPA